MKGTCPFIFLQDLHHMIHLGRVGDQDYRHVTADHPVENLPQRREVLR